jgi:hypothetical protein
MQVLLIMAFHGHGRTNRSRADSFLVRNGETNRLGTIPRRLRASISAEGFAKSEGELGVESYIVYETWIMD